MGIFGKSSRKKASFAKKMAVIFAFLLIVGAFLPWGITGGENLMKAYVMGIEGDGQITLICGALSIILLMFRKRPHFIAFILGLVAAGIAAIDINTMYTAAEKVSGKVGYGLYLTVVAGIGLMISTRIEMLRCRK
jgi:hypothetical protein